LSKSLISIELSFMKIIKKIIVILSPDERKRAITLLFMILVMAFLDMLGVASIMPFMAVLANPEIVETNAIFSKAYQASYMLGVSSVQEFIFVLGSLVFLLLFITLSFKALTVYAQARFSLMREYSIGRRLIKGYLRKNYSWFLTQNSADLGKNILSEVNLVVANVLIPFMNIIAQSAVSIFILLLLIVVDPWLALNIALLIGLIYSLVFKATKNILSRIGQERLEDNKARYIAVNEAFGAAKEVKIGGLEDFYIHQFSLPAKRYAKNLSAANIIGQLPRFALELIIFGGMLLVILYLMSQNDSFSSAVPVISLYALAGYRLMPSLQGIYTSVSQLRFAISSLNVLMEELRSIQAKVLRSDKQALSFMQDISLKNVTYSYPNSGNSAIKNINLTIPAKSTVGFVGSTGSGKTTIVDLILGLLEPQQGALEIDGIKINEKNKKNWHLSIGYVPQHIYLADDSVEANIAFGVASKDVDLVAVERVTKIADLHDFVTKQLPDQYKTKVGERGMRLSGGQRQRIGIARALYHNPQVLVLDEATSALDNLTEQAVMEAVHNLGQEITVIMIAHRLSTVKECDTIFFLENGELTGQGSFAELLQSNERFRAMNKT
jgi:ATP-binding cassette, subfamily B, bacterial PglK